MEEIFLFSNVRPLLAGEGRLTINNCFREKIQKSNRLEIATGFSSFYSLKELNKLVMQYKIKKVSLILGMYFFNGFQEKLLKLALEINKRWQEMGIGEIRLIHSFRYHGKLYSFIKDDQIQSVIIGSANLSFLVSEEETSQHQYEIVILTNKPETLKTSLIHINELKSTNISENIAILEEKKLLSIIKLSPKEIRKISKIP